MAWKNKEIKNQYARDYDRRTRIKAIERYGGVCACCGEHRYVFLALDHIHHGKGNPAPKGGVSLHVRLRREGYPKGIQVLCHNCNAAKSILGYCIHEQEGGR